MTFLAVSGHSRKRRGVVEVPSEVRISALPAARDGAGEGGDAKSAAEPTEAVHG